MSMTIQPTLRSYQDSFFLRDAVCTLHIPDSPAMGQWYKFALLNIDGSFLVHLPDGHQEYENVKVMMWLLSPDSPLYMSLRVVWAGDYAPDEPGTNTNLYFFTTKKKEIDEDKNEGENDDDEDDDEEEEDETQVFNKSLADAVDKKGLVFLMGKHNRIGGNSPVQLLVDDLVESIVTALIDSYPVLDSSEFESCPTFPFLVNHTKRVFINTLRIPDNEFPLSLLTSEGNGRSSRDFYGESSIRVGSWSRDILSTELSPPSEYTEEVFMTAYIEQPFFWHTVEAKSKHQAESDAKREVFQKKLAEQRALIHSSN